MPKNLPIPSKSTELTLGKAKSLLGITAKILKGKAVITSQSIESFILHEDITIMGNLMWAKEAKDMMNHSDASDYARNLKLGEHNNWVITWRLPTKKELIEAMRLCGGEEVSYSLMRYYNDESTCKKNIKNTSYQSCYKRNGFSSYEYLAGIHRYFSTYDDVLPELSTETINFYNGIYCLKPTDICGHIRCVSNGAYNIKLYNKLCELRTQIASKKGIPPYIVFSDKTIKDLSLKVPQNKEEMLEVHGIGEGKYERYGEVFLDILQSYESWSTLITRKLQ